MMIVKYCCRRLLYVAFVIRRCQNKTSEKLTKMVNIEEENLHVFWKSNGLKISMKLSGMRLRF